MPDPCNSRTAKRLIARGPAIIATAALVACGGAAPSSAPSAAAAPAAAAKAKAAAREISACSKRPDMSGDLYVRTVEPGLQAQAQEIGGGWSWDSTSGKCLDSLDFTLATAGRADGECTTVGYKSGNPGYNPDAAPAAKLKTIAGEAGPGC